MWYVYCMTKFICEKTCECYFCNATPDGVAFLVVERYYYYMMKVTGINRKKVAHNVGRCKRIWRSNQ